MLSTPNERSFWGEAGPEVEPVSTERGVVETQQERVRSEAHVDAIAEEALSQKVEQIRGITEIRGTPLELRSRLSRLPLNVATRSPIDTASPCWDPGPKTQESG